MKLKCLKHDRRVIAVGDNFIHRTGDGSHCDSAAAVIGGDVVTPLTLMTCSEEKITRYRSLCSKRGIPEM